MYGVTQQSTLRAYFLAAASIFEPSRAAERLAWARTAVLAEAISRCLLKSSNTDDDRTTTAEWLVNEFVNTDDDNQARSVGTLLPY
jgi:ent-copalyl diphosphate synthase